MEYHYAEGWVTFLHRFSMSVYEAHKLGLLKFTFKSVSSQEREPVHHLEIQDWFDKNIKHDWFYDVYNDNIVWFGFNDKSEAELFRMVWG